MEGGQKAEISLTSELDIKSSDMLVPITQPKFQHNRQRYQGHYLPSSLRYEHDGWAVGNDIYQFEFDNFSVETSPAGFTVLRRKLNNNPAYILQLQKVNNDKVTDYAKVYWNYASSCSDVANINDLSGNTTYISDTLPNGTPFNITINTVTGNITHSPSLDVDWVVSGDGKSTITIIDTTTHEVFALKLYAFDDIYNGTEKFADKLTFTDGIYKWDGSNDISYTAGSSVMSVNGTSVPVTLTDNTISGIYTRNYVGSISTQVTTEKFYPTVYNLKVAPLIEDSGYIINDNATLNKNGIDNFSATGIGSTLKSTQPIFVRGTLPFWYGLLFKFAYGVGVSPIDSKDVALDVPASSDTSYKITFTATSGGVLQLYDGTGETIKASYWAAFDKGTFQATESKWKYRKLKVTCSVKVSLPENSKWLDEHTELGKTWNEGFYYTDAASGATSQTDYYFTMIDLPLDNHDEPVYPSGYDDPFKIENAEHSGSIAGYTWYNSYTSATYMEHSVEYDEGWQSDSYTPPSYAVYSDARGFIIAGDFPDYSIYSDLTHCDPDIWTDENDTIYYWYIWDVKPEIVIYYFSKNKVSNDDIKTLSFAVSDIDFRYAHSTSSNIDSNITVHNLTHDDVAISAERMHIIEEPTGRLSGKLHMEGAPIDGILFGYAYYVVDYDYDTMKLSVSEQPSVNYGNIQTTYSCTHEKEDGTYIVAGAFNMNWQFVLSMEDKLTSTNAVTFKDGAGKTHDGKITITPAPDASLAFPNQPYCDRARNSKDADYFEFALCSLIMQINSDDSTVDDASFTIAAKVKNDDVRLFYALWKNDYDSNDIKPYDYYIPGYIYNDDINQIDSVDGHCKAFSTGSTATDYTTKFAIKGTGKSYSYITGMTSAWSDNMTSGHEFFNVLQSWKDSLQFTFDDLVMSFSGSTFTGTQALHFKFRNISIDGTFESVDNSINIDGNSYTVDGYNAVVAFGDRSIKSIATTVTVPLTYNLSTALPYIENNEATITEINGSIYTAKRGDKTISIDIGSLVVAYRGNIINMSKESDTVYLASVDVYDKLVLNAIIRGAFKTENCTIRQIYADKVVVTVDGVDYTIDISATGLFNTSERSHMQYKYTFVEDPEMQQIQIANIDPDNEYQFLKQQWDTTVATENFWWVDSTHILALTQSKFILREKTDQLDDWNGDIWEDASETLRGDILYNEIARYGMSSAYAGAQAYFWTLQKTTSTTFILQVYDPLNNMSRKLSISLFIYKQTIQTALMQTYGNSALCTYSNINIDNFLSQSKLTSTCRDGYLLFGIHYDNNFNQWAVKINLTTGSFSVLQGYGFVGVDGCLTGGEIPTSCYSVSEGGFSKVLLPLTALLNKTVSYPDTVGATFDWETDQTGDIITQDRPLKSVRDFFAKTEAEIYEIKCLGAQDIMVVGTAEQQWYISKNVPSIVSHLTWDSNNWVIHELPLNNNLAQKYASGSFANRTLSEYIPYVLPFNTMFPQPGGDQSILESTLVVTLNVLLALAGEPMIFGLAPKFNSGIYEQQSLGQYAYVHYNSSSIHQSKDMSTENTSSNTGGRGTSINDPAEEQNIKTESPESADEISFNAINIRQAASINNAWNSLIAALVQVSVSAADFATQNLQVNMHNNQTTMSDSGRKFSQIFLQNMDTMSSVDNTLNGISAACSSAVAGVLTLDMFYSTSDKQHVEAGPGWVNHNFVAQVVAQSATSNQTEISQVACDYKISALTMFQLEIEHRGMELATQALYDSADTYKSGEGASVMGSGPGDLPYKLIATGLLALYYVAKAALTAMEVCLEEMPTILEGLGADKCNVSITYRMSKHAYDLEGKHRYGSKSECFMWPCFGVDTPITVVDERVTAVSKNTEWYICMPIASMMPIEEASSVTFGTVSTNFGVITSSQEESVKGRFKGNVAYWNINCAGEQSKKTLPADMAAVIGCESILPKEQFRNENIGVSEPVFPTPPFQDYIIDKQWEIGQTASVGMTTWVSCKDTKLIDGEYSNIVISDSFCGVAAPYTAIEVKRGVSREYMRPWAITPTALLLNQTGINCCYERKAYHACDGFGYRVVEWIGAAGMNKEHRTWLYSFLVNDRFKRSNKMPLNEYLGNFKSDPSVANYGDINDKVFTLVTQPSENKGLTAGSIGEDKDARRYSMPIFSEFVSTLPAVVKTIAAVSLSVVDGITTLTTDNRDLQTAYKAPLSVDFAIGKQLYRYTSEYICSLTGEHGVTIVKEIVPCLGLTFIGSTPYEAYLYSKATRQYYMFTGGSSLDVVDMIERFRDVVNGRYDFVNQEVLMPCLATFLRLDPAVIDDEDETDNVIIPRLKDGKFIGEVCPPIETIYNTRSWFRTLSMPMGVVYQGPNRCIVNRFVFDDYMLDQIKANYGLWTRVPREEYHPFRKYRATYEQVDIDIGDKVLVKGWTHNPFLLVTAPLGTNEDTDNMYEWVITFCWPVEMDKLYGTNDYAVVNIQAETMTPGGKVISARPTHIFLYKELFTRTGCYGYYSFRYTGECGAGNRERLHIWSDQYICISSLSVEYKQVTERRTEQLTQQVDVQSMNEI